MGDARSELITEYASRVGVLPLAAAEIESVLSLAPEPETEPGGRGA